MHRGGDRQHRYGGDLRQVRGFFDNLLAAPRRVPAPAARIYQVLLVLFVLDTFHSPGLTGLVIFASQVPGTLFSPIAGALLDRRGRVVLMAADFTIAGASMRR